MFNMDASLVRRTHLGKRRPDPGDTSNYDIEDAWQQHRNYGIVIDAGSSGSRVQVYSWKDHEFVRKTKTLQDLTGLLPTVERGDRLGLKWTFKEEPGISTYGNKPKEVGEHLRPLLNFALEVIPEAKHSTTPVFLMATAGMRLLSLEEQHAILDNACRYITSNYQFKVDDCSAQVRVISGEQEGIFGWIAVNYLMGGFDASSIGTEEGLVDNDIDTQFLVNDDGEPRHHTFGFLDMGGASTQIAFEPEHHQKEEHMDDLTRVVLRTLDGQEMDYDVFVTTFLGYGSNEARRRYLEERVREVYYSKTSAEADSVDSLIDDSPADRNLGGGLESDDNTLHLDDPCLPLNLTMRDDSTSVSLTLHGQGAFSECLAQTLGLLNKKVDCPTEPCLFNGVHTPSIDFSVNQFVGISEYWYSAHDILGLGGVYDFVEYERKATEFCGTQWSSIMDDHQHGGIFPSHVEIQRLEMQCFKAAWIVNVLHDGIGIPRIVDPGGRGTEEAAQEVLDQTIESVRAKHWNPPFQSINTINDIQVSWTLGAILMHSTRSIPLAEGAGGRPSHSTDDEGPHRAGKTAPSHGNSHYERPLPPIEMLTPTPLSDPQNGFDWRSMGTGPFEGRQGNVGGFVVMGIMVLVCLIVWWIFSRRNFKRRGPDGPDYRRLEGGVGGGGSMSPPQSAPAVIFHTLRRLVSHTLMTIRLISVKVTNWSSVGSSSSSGSRGWPPVPTSLEAEMMTELRTSLSDEIPLRNAPSSIVIQNNINIQRTSTPTTGPPNFSGRYWSKKRFSGDSNMFGFAPTEVCVVNTSTGKVPGLPTTDGVVPAKPGLQSRSNSYTNLAIRANSATNLAAMGSSPNPSQTSTAVSTASTIYSPKPSVPIQIPRSRMSFVINEMSDEEDQGGSPPSPTSTLVQPPSPQARASSTSYLAYSRTSLDGIASDYYNSGQSGGTIVARNSSSSPFLTPGGHRGNRSPALGISTNVTRAASTALSPTNMASSPVTNNSPRNSPRLSTEMLRREMGRLSSDLNPLRRDTF
ncbi:nucleoside phosphatase family-domain-containing protein [Jimgerdemannia flammicorona]|uniref:Nucleoside phosphatase family-domain-containing protein n=1 Tax=Jimgerdemannia flammicorona TaxID=994334 RepID=A0A433QMT9_9FUNG|nr:nucleoside phosphatase family-domain-containing protein [Jimgerdemannia flammicorona]